jgi:predicted  nucleic acid-binding Zn-ribbon protein
MAKQKDPLEADIKRLREKVAASKAKTENAQGDAALRALHKRLKRVQRKKRALASRLAHAQGKKKEAKPAASPPAAPPAAAAAAG